MHYRESLVEGKFKGVHLLPQKPQAPCDSNAQYLTKMKPFAHHCSWGYGMLLGLLPAVIFCSWGHGMADGAASGLN